MLFIAMIEAAALAAVSASGDSFGANSAMSASLTAELRAASALATNAPAFCCSLSTVSAARLERFSFRSLAYSGSCCFRDSRDIGKSPWMGSCLALTLSLSRIRGRGDSGGTSGLDGPLARAAGEDGGEGALRGLQDRLALLPVAGAKLVGLQRVEHAQDLLRVAADAEVVDRHEADHALGIDDEGGAQRDALLLVEDAERARQPALDVGEHGERQVLQVRMVLPPGQVHGLAVGGGSVDHRVAIREDIVLLAAGRDRRPTD